MPLPEVSVLLPVRDGAATLGATLSSLAHQTLPGVELVVVDDGSSDGSARRVRELWEGPLTLLSPGRVGLSAALQAGLAAARGRLVARMDADDVAHPRRLELQAAYLERHPEMDVLGSRVRTFSDTGAVGGGWHTYDDWQNRLLHHRDIVRELFVESPLAHPSVMFRRDRVLAVGGYREVPWPEDYDLWLRGWLSGLRFAKVPEVLLEWRDHAGRTSRREARYGPEAFRRCKLHYLVRGPLAEVDQVVVWGAGRGGRRLAQGLCATGRGIRAFVDVDPRKIDGQEVLSPDRLPDLRGSFLLAAVGSRGARELIRARLADEGWVEGDDFLCVA